MAERPRITIPRARNPRTHAIMRRQVFWQIALPLALAVAGMVALAVLATLQPAADRRPWADVSLILLILPAALGGLLVLALLVGLCVGVWYALREAPYLFNVAQIYVALVAGRIKSGSGKAANGVISARAAVAAGRQTAAGLRALVAPRRKR